MLTEQQAVQQFNDAYNQGLGFWGQFLHEAQQDLKINMGDQWEAKDKLKLKNEHRNALIFNKVKRINRMISGYQRKNRLALKIDPVEGSDEKTAEQFTGITLHTMSSCHGYHVMSEAFESGCLKTGINLVNVYMDFLDDPLNGDIKLARVPYNKFMIDPFFSKRDLSDCGWILRREYFAKMQVKALLPMVSGRIEKMRGRARDDKFTYFQPPLDMSGEKLMSYDEFWKRDFKSVKMMVDRQSGAIHEVTGASRERLYTLTKAYPELVVKKRYKPTVELYVLVNGECVWKGEDPYGLGDLPYVAIMGFWEPEYNESHWKLQALTRCMRDPQDETNKRRSKLLDMVDAQIGTGWQAEEGSIVNPAALYRNGQGVVVWSKEGKFGMAKQLQTVDIPQGFFRLMEQMDRDIVEIPGGTDELLGQSRPGEKLQALSGVLGKLRQASGLVGLQDMFDNYRLAKVSLGRKIVKLVQANYRPEKVQRIINEQPTPEFYNKKFGKYDCVPQEGVLSDSQRQMYYAELLGLKEMGAPIPWVAIIDAAPIQHKSKLRDSMDQAEKAAAEAAKYDKLMERLSAALVQAEAQAKIAGAREKISQDLQNRANAALDRIKAMKELGQMDEQNVLALLKMILEIEKIAQQPAPTANASTASKAKS